jgi:uncharacterized protein DUF4365
VPRLADHLECRRVIKTNRAQHIRRAIHLEFESVPFAMDPSQRKEQFQYSYLLATATAAGFWLSDPRVDFDSVDCTVRAQGSDGGYSSPLLDVQLKCTAADDPLPVEIPFRLKRKNYEDLRDPHRFTPIILAVCFVPIHDDRWLEYGERLWTARYDCFWLSLRGCAPLGPRVESKTVHVPRAQRLTSEELRRLMGRISRERTL